MSVRLLLVMGMILMLTGCGSGASGTPAPAAVDVVSDFYYWYLGYPGNVLAEGGYHDHEALTADFVARLDDFVSQRMFYDPILCAQDLPGENGARVLGVIHDITDEVLREQELLRVKAEQEALMNGTDDLIQINEFGEVWYSLSNGFDGFVYVDGPNASIGFQHQADGPWQVFVGQAVELIPAR